MFLESPRTFQKHLFRWKNLLLVFSIEMNRQDRTGLGAANYRVVVVKLTVRIDVGQVFLVNHKGFSRGNGARTRADTADAVHDDFSDLAVFF